MTATERQSVHPQEARDALASVSCAEAAGQRAAMAPRWFVWVSAALVGGMFAAQEGALALAFLLALVFLFRVRKRDRSAYRRRAKMSDHPGWAAVGVAIGLALMAGWFWTGSLAERGAAWAPVAFGGAVGLALIGLHEWGRARLRADGDTPRGAKPGRDDSNE